VPSIVNSVSIHGDFSLAQLPPALGIAADQDSRFEVQAVRPLQSKSDFARNHFRRPCPKGESNCAAHRYPASIELIRKSRARNFRCACAGACTSGNPAGISSQILELSRRCLRIARSTPPALTFRIVLNSRISFPRSSGPRTKTGMARGIRGHRRRSFTVLPDKGVTSALWGVREGALRSGLPKNRRAALPSE